MKAHNHVILFLIRIYQKYISPHKGYQCAHGVLTGKDSCSEAVTKIIQQVGFFSGLGLIRQQFEDCRHAAEILKKKKEKRKRDDNDKCCESCAFHTKQEACSRSCDLDGDCCSF